MNINNKKSYYEAMAELEGLLTKGLSNLTDSEHEKLDSLTDAIEAWEKTEYSDKWGSMKQWSTKIRAEDPVDGQMKTWFGPSVPGITKEDAQQYCKNNEMGYCDVWQELISETPNKEGWPYP